MLSLKYDEEAGVWGLTDSVSGEQATLEGSFANDDVLTWMQANATLLEQRSIANPTKFAGKKPGTARTIR